MFSAYEKHRSENIEQNLGKILIFNPAPRISLLLAYGLGRCSLRESMWR